MSHPSVPRSHALVAGLALLVGTVTTVAGTAIADVATIELSKASGPPTTRISVSGVGFGATETVDLSFGGVEMVAVDTDAAGEFTGGFRIPASTRPGEHPVSAHGRLSGAEAAATFLAQTDWGQYRGDSARRGFNRYENVLNPSNVSRLELIWTFDTGDEVLASPTVAGGVVYAGSQSGELHALDMWTGDERWAVPGGTFGSPAAEGGVVYVARSTVAALDAATGEPIWSFGDPDDQWGSSPALRGDVLYVVSSNTDVRAGRIVALDAATGALLWDRYVRGYTWGAPAVARGTVIVGTIAGRVYSLDASTGDVQWTFRAAGYVVESAAVTGDRVFIAGSEEGLYALDASTGDRLWSSPGRGGGTAPAVVVGVVYEGTGYGNVDAYGAPTGTLLWRFHAGGGDVESAPTVANGVVYVGSNGDTIYALDADSGEELWSYRAGGGIQSSPTVADGMVYVGCKDGLIYAFGLR